MRPRFRVDQRVVAVRALRNDGTYPDPDLARGAILVPRGTAGYLVDVGTFLQDHLVYAVAFDNGRLVGCLEGELQPLGETRAGKDPETGAVLGSGPAGREEERGGAVPCDAAPRQGGERHAC